MVTFSLQVQTKPKQNLRIFVGKNVGKIIFNSFDEIPTLGTGQ
jgi:hypothetical protein